MVRKNQQCRELKGRVIQAEGTAGAKFYVSLSELNLFSWKF